MDKHAQAKAAMGIVAVLLLIALAALLGAGWLGPLRWPLALLFVGATGFVMIQLGRNLKL